MRSPVTIAILAVLTLTLSVTCSQQAPEPRQLMHFAVDDLSGVVSPSEVVVDRSQSTDGNGSLKAAVIQADSAYRSVALFETGDLDVENALLSYQARVKTENLSGQVFLEMWCHFPGKGEYFSRNLQAPVRGTTGWTLVETPFLLREGENPDNVRLNLLIAGSGSVWVDDIRLIESPLPN